MKRDLSFHDYIVYDVLGYLPGITSRAMFGGWGIYQNGLIFGLIVGNELYFKVNDQNRSSFEEIESHPFSYDTKDRKKTTMGYWSVPEELFMKKEELATYVHGAVAASLTAKTKGIKPKKK